MIKERTVMKLTEFYRQRKDLTKYNVMNIFKNSLCSLNDEKKYEEKEDILLPLITSSEIKNTELKTFYFTSEQIALIQAMSAKKFTSQSGYLCKILTDGLIIDIMHSEFTEEEKLELKNILDCLVETDLVEKSKVYKKNSSSN